MAIISLTGTDSFKANHGYHITARAIGNLRPFATDAQKAELLARFSNHLSAEPTHNRWGRPYEKLTGQVTPLSFNVMDNHLHKLVHQFPSDAITRLMARVMARQADSFNRQSGWRGRVFEPFNAMPYEETVDPTQIKDMALYIELNNPILQFETPFASFQVMTGELECDWFDPTIILRAFGGVENYCEHMNRRGPAVVKRKLFEWGIDWRRHPYRPIDPGMFRTELLRTGGASDPLRTKGATDPLRIKGAQLTIP